MFYDVSYLGPWLLLTLLLGGAVGWRMESPGPQQPWFEGWFRYALIALAVVFVLSLIGVFAGRNGFWLETAVLFFAAYVLGALAGGFAQRLRVG